MSERKGLILSLLEEHDYEAVIKLLDANPSVAHNTYNGITTLALALKNEKTTLKLIEIAPELILYKDSSGNLPIHIACRNSHVKVILKLLELQPETIYERNKAGCHCLHYVVQRINEKEILKLIDEIYKRDNLSILAKTVDGMLPIHFAAIMNSSRKVLELLIKYGPQTIKIPEENFGRFPLHMAIVANAKLHCIKTLVEAFPDALNIRDMTNCLPIHLAIEYNIQPHVIDSLTDPNIERNENTLKEESLSLHYAISHHSEINGKELGPPLDILKSLMHNIPISSITGDVNGDVPIFTALMQSKPSYDVIKLIVTTHPHCCMEPRQHDGNLALHTAIERRLSADIVSIIAKTNTRANRHMNHDNKLPLHYACWQNAAISTTLALLDAYPEAAGMHETKYKNTPLHYAVQYGAPLPVIIKLLEIKPDLIKERNIDDSLPIHLAARYGAEIKIVDELLKDWPDAIMEMDGRGATPVHLGLEARSDGGATGDVLRLLLKQRAEKLEELAEGPEDGVDFVEMSDFDRSAMEYELRCQKERIAKEEREKGLEAKLNEKINNNTNTNSNNKRIDNNGALIPMGLDSKATIEVKQQLRMQTDEIRRLKAQIQHSMDAVEMGNTIKKQNNLIKELQHDNKMLLNQTQNNDKQLSVMKADIKHLSHHVEAPKDVLAKKQGLKKMEEEILAQQQLIRELRNDMRDRDSIISDQSSEIKNIKSRLAAQTDYAKKKESEYDKAHIFAEELREEIIQLRKTNEALKQTANQLSEELDMRQKTVPV